jgi:hypothetical protein
VCRWSVASGSPPGQGAGRAAPLRCALLRLRALFGSQGRLPPRPLPFASQISAPVVLSALGRRAAAVPEVLYLRLPSVARFGSGPPTASPALPLPER